MVHCNDPGPATPLKSLADHCAVSRDHIIYLRISHGWSDLVNVLDEYDGPWRDATRIDIDHTGVKLTDFNGKQLHYQWRHFGITPPSN